MVSTVFTIKTFSDDARTFKPRMSNNRSCNSRKVEAVKIMKNREQFRARMNRKLLSGSDLIKFTRRKLARNGFRKFFLFENRFTQTGLNLRTVSINYTKPVLKECNHFISSNGL